MEAKPKAKTRRSRRGSSNAKASEETKTAESKSSENTEESKGE